MSNVVQRSMAGGEIAPAFFARVDQVKYATGLRTCRNFVVLRAGGVSNRPGTTWIHEAKDSSQALRLLPFIFVNVGTNNTYLLEFGNQTLRFIQTGGVVVTNGVGIWVTATAYTQGDLVTQSGVTYYCIAGHTSGAGTQPGIGASWQTNWYALTNVGAGPTAVYEIPTPFLAADLPDVQFVQSKDVVTLVHPSYPPQELKRFSHTRWTLNPIVFGPAVGSPTSLAVAGGLAGPSQRYWAVTAIDDITSEESLPSIVSATTHVPDSGTPTTVSWALVSGADSYNIYRSTDGISYGYIGTVGGTPNAATDTSWSSASDTITTSTTGSYVQSVGQARNPVVAVATDKATDGNYHVYATCTVTAASLGGTPSFTLGRIRAFYKRDAETRVDAGIVFGPSLLSGVGTNGPNPFTASINVPDNGYAALTIDLVPEVEGVGSGSNQYQCTVDASSAPNNRIDWTKGGSSFSDVNTTPNMAEAPPVQPVIFASPANYPSTVGYYQERQLFGNTGTDPERVWASRSASFKSFTSSTPLQDDDSISFRMAGRRLNAIRHFMDLYGREIVFTAESEWTLEGDQAGTLLPTAVNPRQQTAAGIGRLRPLVVVSTALFVQARGAIVRDLRKALTAYNNSDLTIFASHLFDGYSIADWDFAQTPHSVVWAVRSDGILLGLTYIPEQDIWGWHRHDTDGVYENVCVLPEGGEDAIYVVVRRTINGTSKRYVERFNSRAITALTDVRDLSFVDASLTYDGRNVGVETMTVTGGAVWDETELLTVTRSVGGFVSGDAGTTSIFLTAADGTELRVLLDTFTSGTVMTGHANRIVPADLRAAATTHWSRAAKIMSGLSHLEGKAVSVYADGYVESSPNNSVYPTLTVTGGSVTLSQPRAVVHAGLPYMSDLETLDIDTAQGASLKESYRNVSRVGAFVQDTRGLWWGPASGPTTAQPLRGLEEMKLRDQQSAYGPTILVTDSKQVSIENNWNDNGRVFVRQVDPLPATILSITPMGKL